MSYEIIQVFSNNMIRKLCKTSLSFPLRNGTYYESTAKVLLSIELVRLASKWFRNKNVPRDMAARTIAREIARPKIHNPHFPSVNELSSSSRELIVMQQWHTCNRCIISKYKWLCCMLSFTSNSCCQNLLMVVLCLFD